MKNESDSIKKYNLSDLLVNTRKFKDFLDSCKKKNLISEKKALMEELITNLQEKQISKNALALTEYLNNCAFAIIFSDFEVELFFEIKHFNPDLQKNMASCSCLHRYTPNICRLHNNRLCLGLLYW